MQPTALEILRDQLPDAVRRHASIHDTDAGQTMLVTGSRPEHDLRLMLTGAVSPKSAAEIGNLLTIICRLP